jgi:hypothetical protein
MEQPDNMRIWSQIEKTDTKYTKDAKVLGQNITAINGTYAAQQATKVFGPCGEGWGITLKEDRFDNTAPHLNDAGEVVFWYTQHTAIIDFWYKGSEGEICTIPAAGHTPALSRGSSGPYYDSDPLKKSMTDALKKALSLLGFSADIWMGLFDDVNYKATREAESLAEKADEMAEQQLAKRREFWGWAKEAVNKYEGCHNKASLDIIHTQAQDKAWRDHKLCGEDEAKVRDFFMGAYNKRLKAIQSEKEKQQ